MEIKKRFFSDIKILPQLIAWVIEALNQQAVDGKILKAIELIVEEAAVNIIRYSLKNPKSTFVITLKKDPSSITIKFVDEGPLFDPTKANITVDPSLSMEERKEGGLGIFFIKQYADDMHYQRQGNKNVFTIIKNI